MNDHALTLFKNLNTIDAIARELPAIGKRSELKVKAHDILLLLEEVRLHASALEKEIISLKYEYPAQRFERVKGVKRG